MKGKLLTLFSLLLLISLGAQAQKIKERDVLGTWKLVIDIEEEMEEEAEEADTILEEVIINSVSGLVSGIMDNIDIYFEFKKNNELLITVNAYDDIEEERGSWYINKNGNLVIEDIDDNDKINVSTDDEEWRLVDGLLISEDHLDDRNVYMAKVD